jgi:hypothetical protein
VSLTSLRFRTFNPASTYKLRLLLKIITCAKRTFRQPRRQLSKSSVLATTTPAVTDSDEGWLYQTQRWLLYSRAYKSKHQALIWPPCSRCCRGSRARVPLSKPSSRPPEKHHGLKSSKFLTLASQPQKLALATSIPLATLSMRWPTLTNLYRFRLPIPPI